VFGLVPAVQLPWRSLYVLNQSDSRSVKGTRGRFRQGLIVAQVALTRCVVTGSGLLIRSFTRVQSVEKGFEPHSTVTMNLSLDANIPPPNGRLPFTTSLSTLSVLFRVCRRPGSDELTSRARRNPQLANGKAIR